MAPVVSKRAKVFGYTAVLAVIVAWSKKAYPNAPFLHLVKRLLGFILGRILPIPVPRAVSGAGSTTKVASVLREMGCKKPLLVTDENLIKFGLVKPCTDALTAEGFTYEVFDKVVPNPPASSVEDGYALYKKGACDSIIAFGGGSPMDTAKVIGAKACNPKSVESYEGFFQINMGGLKPLPPFIAVPTTAGTGSETTVAAVISIPEKQKKIAIADLGLVPRVAVLDPTVLEKLPKPITAATGMDALTHAVESYLGGWTSAFTREKSLSATGKIFRHILATYNNGSDLAAREHMLNASYEAGLAFTRANVGYVHAIAHQLGGIFHTPHGDANAMLLPYVLDFYLEDEGEGATDLPCTQKYCELAQAGGLAETVPAEPNAKRALARKFVARIREMNNEMNLPADVPDMKVEHVQDVAKRALREAHGELHGFGKPVAHLLDLGYPVPRYISLSRCERIVAEILPEQQKLAWVSKAK